MKRTLILILLLAGLCADVAAQRKRSVNKGLLINGNKPTVYVSFVGKKALTNDAMPGETRYYFFKLTNNTRWKIWMDMAGTAVKAFGDISLYFAIEDKETDKNRYGSTSCHVCSVNPIGPGRSVVFSVPGSYVEKDARMRLVYRFDWEEEMGSYNGSQIVHSVEYYFSSLPTTPL